MSTTEFSKRVAVARLLILLSVMVGASLGCQTIAGIEERSLGPCGEYCDTVMAACQDEHQVYTTTEICMGVCQLLPAGDSLEPTGENSVACRLVEARLAASAEPDVHCPRAGPAGGGNCGDGGACESYCGLYPLACGDTWYTYGTPEECMASCAALPDTGGFDLVGDYDGDTIQCRLVHASSSTIDPGVHCAHAQLVPPTAPCADPPTGTPDCNKYCDIVGVACVDDNAQYENPEQCLASCAVLEPGHNEDTTVNTVGCRVYHSYNSLLDPATHCGHAGPTGDGHCGTVSAEEQALCDSYCRIAAEACSAEFESRYTQASCVAACSGLEDAARDSYYSVTKGISGGDTLSCRTLHAARALAGDTGACAAALGAAPCL